MYMSLNLFLTVAITLGITNKLKDIQVDWNSHGIS
jgi:hypothetical protein